MTRRSKREIERLLDELEPDGGGQVSLSELSDTQREHLDEVLTAVRGELDNAQNARLDELAEQLSADGFEGHEGGLTDAEREFYDLLGEGLKT